MSVRFEKTPSSAPATKQALPPASYNGPKIQGPPSGHSTTSAASSRQRRRHSKDGRGEGRDGSSRRRRREGSRSSSSRGRRTSSAGRRRRRRSSASASPAHMKPPMCPNDLGCAEINDQGHQAEYRHTCRRSSCEYLWMEEHRRLFVHSDTLDGPDRRPPPSSGAQYSIPAERDCPPCHPYQHPSPQHVMQEPHHHWGAQSIQYQRPPVQQHVVHHHRDNAFSPLRPTRSPLRPPPRPTVLDDDDIFNKRGGGSAAYAGDVQPASVALHTTEVVHVAAPIVGTAQHTGDESELAELRRRQQVLEQRILRKQSNGSVGRVARGTHSLEDIDSHLGERLQGFTLLKELDNLAMEVRTLRHLQHFRTPLTEDHDHATVAYQLHHSARRVAAGIRRVKHLRGTLHPDDSIQRRALDEITFAEELLAATGAEGADAAAPPAYTRHTHTSDKGRPRLVGTSVSAAMPSGRNIETPQN